MKPTVVADEMFPEGAGTYMDLEEAGGSSGLLMDLAANEKAVHADFFNATWAKLAMPNLQPKAASSLQGQKKYPTLRQRSRAEMVTMDQIKKCGMTGVTIHWSQDFLPVHQ
ncbi:uncharacterized protein GBIM_06790, partial [Gryllus bimaculatus]